MNGILMKFDVLKCVCEWAWVNVLGQGWSSDKDATVSVTRQTMYIGGHTIFSRIFLSLSASMGQVWSLGMALQVQSVPRGFLCCLTRTASVSSGWSWSLSASTAVSQTSWPTHTPQTWRALRTCCATCSHGHPDESSFGALQPPPFASHLCSKNVTITTFVLVLLVFQANFLLLCNQASFYLSNYITMPPSHSTAPILSMIAGDIQIFYLCIYLFIPCWRKWMIFHIIKAQNCMCL